MVFSSHLFIYYFLPAVLLVYYLAPQRGRHLWLTLASYAFYGWANPAFMALMLWSTVVDYVAGRRLGALPEEEGRARRAWVTVSIVSNLSLLGFFKYFNFAVDSYNTPLVGAHSVSTSRSASSRSVPARRRCRWASASTPSSR